MDVDNFSIEKDKINKNPDDYDSGANSSKNNREKIGGFEHGREQAEEIRKPEISDSALKEGQGQEGSSGSIISVGQERKKQQERIKAIEKVLEEDLDDIYLAMTQDKRVIFRAEGERACAKINELIERGTLTLKKAVFLIKQWLSYIPGVNKFFLEQEAKIKADEIMNFSKQKYGKE